LYRGKAPPAGPSGHLRIRAYRFSVSHLPSIGGNQPTVEGHSHVRVSPSPPSGVSNSHGTGASGQLGREGRRQAGQAELISEFAEFCDALGVRFTAGKSDDFNSRGLIEWAHLHLEHSFLCDRTFASPMDFNMQLHDWQDTINAQQPNPPEPSPAELINADRQAMRPLPRVPPPTGWKLSMKVGSRPFLHFDSNDYSLHPDAAGRQVKLVADLRRVRVLCDGKLAADHDRAWSHGRVITDPTHIAPSSGETQLGCGEARMS
jgi:hypothetical protein